MRKTIIIAILSGVFSVSALAKNPDISYTVSMANPSSHTFHIEMMCKNLKMDSAIFNLPVWTPGYYQIMDFPDRIQNIVAYEGDKKIGISKIGKNSWLVDTKKLSSLKLSYDVLTEKEFVAESYLDEERGYIIPGALFIFPKGKLESNITIQVDKPSQWKDIATGLTEIKENTYTAPNYDVLYDSPILIGNLKHLPSFEIKGIPHYFSGYNMGDFNEQDFMDDLKKIIEVTSNMIGDIPYEHYSFIGIGAGRGGIEHLNSTTVSFSGNSLKTRDGKLKTLFFLSHEYFHHYNVKRIRPVELGPFDYNQPNRTNMLWVSEGLSVYYEYLMVKRANLCSEEELLKAFSNNVTAYENDPGKIYQSLASASYETWQDGPFGQTDNKEDKGISYYQKGPIVGLFLDFKIRHETNNQFSLDDVMRYLYNEFYIKKNRGFTEEELREVCEKYASSNLDQFFKYIYTTEPLDYKTFLGYAGLKLNSDENGKYQLKRMDNLTPDQQKIFDSWVSVK
ncbi:M61 family metallopeptidase [Fulvivirga ligni]|uniref:M61 family metallopeptidase n=1 Tax=Fulvivirga ligni TaxID=2904246 RepID=UPI001F427FCE|nr:M61 family peptidase [Fulvivirga ligni]UII20399.1 M61 family peptidase [Fulvivirga ligni]